MTYVKPSGEGDFNTWEQVLDIDEGERCELIHIVRQLATELKESPTATPALLHTALKGISLKSDLAMAIELREYAHGKPVATILVGRPNSGTRPGSYIYRPGLDFWDSFSEKKKKPVHLSNEDLIAVLSEITPKGTFSNMMDTIPESGIAVAHMLASALYPKARTRRERRVYTADKIPVSMSEDTEMLALAQGAPLALRDSELSIVRHNSQIVTRLATSARTLLDIGTIRKTFAFTVDERPGNIHSAIGTLSVSGSDTIPPEHLEEYSQSEDDDPVSAYVRADEDVRARYGLNLAEL